MHPFEPVFPKWERVEERRAGAKRVGGGTHIMNEIRQRQLGRARPAANLLIRFDYENGFAGTRKDDGSRKSVGTCAHDHRIV